MGGEATLPIFVRLICEAQMFYLENKVVFILNPQLCWEIKPKNQTNRKDPDVRGVISVPDPYIVSGKLG